VIVDDDVTLSNLSGDSEASMSTANDLICITCKENWVKTYNLLQRLKQQTEFSQNISV